MQPTEEQITVSIENNNAGIKKEIIVSLHVEKIELYFKVQDYL